MKQLRILLYSIGLLIGGIAVGVMMTNTLQQTDVSKQNTEIVIVNMDQAVSYQGQDRLFSKEILPHLGSYKVTSLEEAKSGVESGKYGAYITIPSDFTANVISLNAQPVSSTFSYQINNYLATDQLNRVIVSIYQFEKQMNNSLGQIYVSAVLSEFQAGQSSAEVVLINDQSNVDVINAISGIDLVETVDIKEIERLENTIPELVLTENEELNKTLVQDLDTKYKEFLSATDTTLFDIRTQLEMNVETLGLTMSPIKDAPILIKDGTLQYETQDTKTTVEQRNKELIDQSTEVVSKTGITKSLAKENETLKLEEKDSIIATSNSKALNEIANYASYGMYEYDFTVNMNSATKENVYPNLLTFVPQENMFEGVFDDTIAKLQYNNSILEWVSSYMSNPDNQDKTILEMRIALSTDPQFALSMLEEEIEPEPCIEGETCEPIDCTDPEGCQPILVETPIIDYVDSADSYVIEAIPTLADIHNFYITQQTNNLFGEMVDGVPTCAIDTLVCRANSYIDTSLTDPLNYTDWYNINGIKNNNNQVVDHSTKIAENEQKIVEAETERQAFIDQISQGYSFDKILTNITKDLNPAQSDIDAYQTKVITNQEAVIEEVKTTKVTLDNYHPTNAIDAKKIERVVGSIDDNLDEIVSLTSSYVKENERFTDESISKANEQVGELQQTIVETNQKGNEKIETGLSGAKGSANNTSLENKALLESFISKLTYTRKGQSVNTQVTDFMLQPMTVEGAYAFESQTNDLTTLLWAMMIVGVISIMGGATFHIIEYRKKRKGE